MTNEEAFEKWYEADAMPLESNWFIKDEDGKYTKDYVYLVWKGWQAAITYMQEQSEPVAWRWKPKNSVLWIYNPDDKFIDGIKTDKDVALEPLYTPPQRQQPLKRLDAGKVGFIFRKEMSLFEFYNALMDATEELNND